MGIVNSKDFLSSREKKKIDEATSNSSLSNIRYVTTEKPKWKVFKKKEIKPIPMYQSGKKKVKGCPCGNNGPCKQKVTPRGVTIHYPQKKKKRFASIVGSSGSYKPPKIDKGYLSNKDRVVNKVKIVRPKKFPTFRLDKIMYESPFESNNLNNIINSKPIHKKSRRRRLRRRRAKTSLF